MRKIFYLVCAMFASVWFINTIAQNNLIVNGGFEDDFTPSRKPGTNIYLRPVAYSEPARIAGYFDVSTQAYWPKIDDATTPVFNTANGIWYHRHTDTYNYVRLYVDELKNTPYGDKCLTFHNVGSGTTSTPEVRVHQAISPFQHVAVQKISLDNTKKYNLSFSYLRMDSLLGVASGTKNARTDNYAVRFVAGVVSSTASSAPYVVDIPIPAAGEEMWKNASITLDLPALIAGTPTLDFTTSAIIFGLQVLKNESGHMLPGQISIDNVVLIEDILNSNTQIPTLQNYRIDNRRLIVNNAVHSIQVFDAAGGLVYQNRYVTAGQSVYTFDSSGVYLVKLNDKVEKIVVR